MLIQQERSDGFLAGLALLAAGIAIGAATQCVGRSRADDQDRGRAPAEHRATDAPPDNGLETLRITLDRATGAPGTDGLVPATIEFQGDRIAARVQLAGAPSATGWTELHVRPERAVAGLQRFVVRPADAQASLFEWMLLEAARRAEVVAPRATFVNLVEDGRFTGVRCLVEELASDSSETGGRFVRLDEDERWVLLFQDGLGCLGGPAGAPPAGWEALLPASSVDVVERALVPAADEVRALRRHAGDPAPSALQALEDLRARTLESIFDVERLAELHALLTLFQVDEAAATTCFFLGPRDERLQPVCASRAALVAASREPVPYRSSAPCAFLASAEYTTALFQQLGRVVHSAWLDELFADLEPELSRLERALADAGTPESAPSLDALEQRLRAQTLFLRQALLPADPVNFAASYAVDDPLAQYVTGEIEVRAWATTRVPVLLEGFRFSNDIFASAASALADAERAGTQVLPGGVVLPGDGRPVAFRFPLNERLASLEAANVLVKSARARSAGKQALTLDVRAVFRTLAAAESSEEMLDFVKHEPDRDAATSGS